MSLYDRRGSIGTLGSARSSRIYEEFNLDDLSDEELRRKLEDNVRMKRILEIENDIFERYLKRHDPEALQKQEFLGTPRSSQKFPPISPARSISGSMLTMSIRDRASPSVWSMQSGNRYGSQSQMSRRLKITLSHRMEMASSDLAEIKKKFVAFQHSIEKSKMQLRAEMEELEIRIYETYEAKEEFENTVVINGVDALTGKIPAEIVIKFVKQWLKTANTIIERIRLKSATTRQQMRKAKRQLIQREQLGETLRPVDFERLKIQNQTHVNRIEATNHVLLDMKRIAGRYSLELTQHKQKLTELLNTFNDIKKEIMQNKWQIDKMQLQSEFTEEQIEKADRQLTALLSLMNEYEVPELLHFVKLQAELRVVQKTHQYLSRRRDIRKVLASLYKSRSKRK